MAIWAITNIADKNGNWLLALLVAVSVIAILMLFLLIMVMPKQRLIQTPVSYTHLDVYKRQGDRRSKRCLVNQSRVWLSAIVMSRKPSST